MASAVEHPIKPFVYIIAVVASISGFMFGWDIGGSGGTFEMDGFREQFGWPPSGATEPKWVADQQGYITAMFSLGCIFGSMPSGALTDWLGRKKSIIALSAIFTVGAALQFWSPNLDVLYTGRFISGIGIGGLSMAATLYQAETAPSRIRGLLVSIQQLSITFGILFAGAINVGLVYWSEGWRISYGGKGVFSLLLCVLMFFMPESPRWLMGQGDEEEAKRVLHLIRCDEEVVEELREIQDNIREEAQLQAGSWADLFSMKEMMGVRTFLGFSVQFLQQFSGINAVMYFAPTIFKTFLGSQMALVANMAVATVNFLSTFIAIYSVDKAGRRPLLILGGFGMALFTGLFALTTCGIWDFHTNKVIGALLILFTALYVVNFAYSWGPLGWVVAAEVFPQRLRGKGMSLTTLANWVTNLIIAKCVPLMILPNNMNLWGTFLFFCSFCVFMAVFVMVFLPETNGVSLENMEGTFKDFYSMPWMTRMFYRSGKAPVTDKGMAFAATQERQMDIETQ